jgi:hypothetical protein
MLPPLRDRPVMFHAYLSIIMSRILRVALSRDVFDVSRPLHDECSDELRFVIRFHQFILIPTNSFNSVLPF